MCIRDREWMLTSVMFFLHAMLFAMFDDGTARGTMRVPSTSGRRELRMSTGMFFSTAGGTCLFYTSGAADERSSVDLGGCRLIKKKIV